ncbi:sensor histidine kinase [Actinokineospora globicatena]|uniref:sensor histidine kinase n=1 Tax=Actinokineospora globicatena TaxID=103729 RepID=UPI0020A33AA7|nr:sensor histidine kinase [Actinokineospora globicatena]MCP2300753.1 Signal transduction histidine kinase [Actinokineospora globicatena]GLW77622.1 two-component sensor histidine kinase [Actinokineospora globicatena]GLW84458.1 two-component sensor histidine kinase [Actinokineospora globicatena]
MERAQRHHTEASTQSFWTWDLYFAVGYVFVTALVLLSHASAADRVASAVAMAALALFYVLYGRRHAIMREERGPAVVFAAVSMALFLTAVWFVGNSTFLLFVMCPLIFMALPLPVAAPLVVLLNVLPPVLGQLRSGMAHEWLDQLPTSFLGLSLSLLIGTYVHRVVAQSHERAALITELEASRAEVAALSHRAGVAQERTRLAGEIHDTLAQGFTSIVTLVQAAESEVDRDSAKVRHALDLAARTARENLAEARALVAALQPSALDAATLTEAVQRLAERLRAEAGIEVAFHTEGDASGLPTGVEVVLLRAAQEAMANIRRHSGAASVTVDIRHTPSGVTLAVTDDGVGFDPAAPADGYGLRGMRARAEQVAGTVSVHSAPGAGTTLTVEVPT